MFKKESTLVRDLSIIVDLNLSKEAHPAPPQSTTVVTPARKVYGSGAKAEKPPLSPRSSVPAKT